MANFPTVGIAGRVSLFVAILVAAQANALPGGSPAISPLACDGTQGAGPKLLETGAKFFDQQYGAKPLHMNAKHCALAICAGAMFGLCNTFKKEAEEQEGKREALKLMDDDACTVMSQCDGVGGCRDMVDEAISYVYGAEENKEYSYEIQRCPRGNGALSAF